MTADDPVRHTGIEKVLVAARAGDQAAFAALVEPLRRELQVRCYRMLGLVEDAVDAVQETLLRAWTRLDSYAAKASFRAWLYGIAAHACLDALRRRKSRTWPTDIAGPAHPQRYDLGALDLPWLQPYPDRLLNLPADTDDEPEAVITARETIELAFLAAIQRLPARQRAVLILRDTLDWSVKDTSAALSLTCWCRKPHPRQDASVYSLMTPLTLLCRRSRKLSRLVTGAGSGLRGAAWSRERCGR